MSVVAIEACGDAPMHLECPKIAFDAIALGIKGFVVPVLVGAVGLGGNHRLHSFGSCQRANRIGIVAFVGADRLGGLSRQEYWGALAVGLLAAGQPNASQSR